jgi:prefoldin subunit 5
MGTALWQRGAFSYAQNNEGGDILNPKLQKVNRDIERARAKIAELETLIPELEKQKTDLENAEVVKAFRSANVAPADFTAFIEAYKANLRSGAVSNQPLPQTNVTEDVDDEE